MRNEKLENFKEKMNGKNVAIIGMGVSNKPLLKYLYDLKCNINLIPYNSVTKTDYEKPSNNEIMKFKYLLEHSGKKVTVRLERGADIDAACGQVSGKTKK